MLNFHHPANHAVTNDIAQKRVTFFQYIWEIRQQFFLPLLITCNLCLRPISNVHLMLRISLLN